VQKTIWILTVALVNCEAALAQLDCSQYKVSFLTDDPLPCDLIQSLSHGELADLNKNTVRILADQRSVISVEGLLTNWLSDTLFFEQDNINQAIFDALGTYSISFDFVDRHFDLTEKNQVRFRSPVILTPFRRVLLNNIGSVDRTEPMKSGYTVVSGLTARLRPEVFLGFGDLGVTLQGGEGGVSLTVIRQTKAPSAITEQQDTAELQHTLFRIPNLDQNRSWWAKALDWTLIQSARPFRILGQQLDHVIFSNFSDDDRSRQFFQNILSPISEGLQLNQFSADAVLKVEKARSGQGYLVNTEVLADNSRLQVGDIVSIFFFRTIGPDVTASLLPFQFRTARQLTNLVHKSVLKLPDGIAQVRYQNVVREGRTHGGGASLSFRYGPLSIGYRPFWHEIQRYNEDDLGYTQEIVYLVDLKTNSGRDAFNALFNGLVPDWNHPSVDQALKDGSLKHEGSGRRTLIGGLKENRNSRQDLDLGFWGVHNRQRQAQEKRTWTVMNDTAEEIVGVAQKERRFKRRLFWREDKASTRGFLIRIDLGHEDAAQKVVLNINSTFRDTMTKPDEYRYFMEYFKLATLNGGILPESLRGAYLKLTQRQIHDRKQNQYAHFNLQLNNRLTTPLFERDHSQMLAVLAELYQIDPIQWSSTKQFHDWGQATKQFQCQTRSIAISKTEWFKDDLVIVPCKEIYTDANKIFSALVMLQMASIPNRVAIFNRFVGENKFAMGKVLFVILRLALGDQDPETFTKSGDLKYFIAFQGDDLEYTQFSMGKLLTLDPNPTLNGFPSLYRPTSPRLSNLALREVKTSNGGVSLVLSFRSQVALDNTDQIKAIFYKYRNVLADTPIFWGISQSPQGIGASDLSTRQTTYLYAFHLPERLTLQLKKRRQFTIQFWIEDKNSERLTETAELRL